jgi:multidrug efflux pump subunit AcrB
MLAIVRIALSRPYTFVVVAFFILLVGTLAALRMPVDIFPSINIPIIGVAWQYQGLPPDQMAGRIVTPFERALTTTVNDIEHIESNSYTTFGIVKIFFHPTVNIATANAQVTAISQSMLKQLPAGTTPPLIINYSASTVPIIQLALSGIGLTEQSLADLGFNFVRPRLVTVQGAGIPWPFGGKTPQVMFDLDTAAMQSRGLTGLDVANALAVQNLITPVGTEKIAHYEYTVDLNSAPSSISDLGDLPIKSVGGAMVYMHDVAQVRNGNAVQTNIVHVDGNRSVLISVFKNGATSTLDIISGIKKMLTVIKPSLPDALQIKPIGDQSIFVRASIKGVIREGVIAAALTSLMILLFLGSVRSTLIVTTSIPLAILGSIATLSAIGETLNIMTLGGLALAVGILVDEATVTIESINYHLEQGKEVETAIIDGASQIVVPAFVSLLCICIVFIPMFFLSGVARFLFVPMAESVIFAMVFSFLLSRTLVPTMAKYLLRRHSTHGAGLADLTQPPSKNPLVRLQRGFEAFFTRLRAGYHDLLALAIAYRTRFVAGFRRLTVVRYCCTCGGRSACASRRPLPVSPTWRRRSAR